MEAPQMERQVMRKFNAYILPVLCLMYFIAWLDRQNVAFAKLEMVQDLGLSEAAYGLGASLFFLAYFLFEVPSNILLRKVGAGLWFARIMVGWGLATIGLAFAKTTALFYLFRFLLGVCEAGFFPGAIYLMTLWLPVAYRARIGGLFIGAGLLANAVGGPVCGALLELDGVAGLRGWQWLFLATGAPAIIIGLMSPWLLPAGPGKARFYSPEEAGWLTARIAAENAAMGAVSHGNPFRALLDRRTLLLAPLFLGAGVAVFGMAYWLPTTLKAFGASNLANGFLNAIPWLGTTAALVLISNSSARCQESVWHIAAPLLLAAAALVGVVLTSDNVVRFILLCVAAAGMYGPFGVMWSLPGRLLQAGSAAAGFAALNSMTSFGGFLAQNLVPMVRDAMGSVLAPMIMLAGVLVASAVHFLYAARLAGLDRPALTPILSEPEPKRDPHA